MLVLRLHSKSQYTTFYLYNTGKSTQCIMVMTDNGFPTWRKGDLLFEGRNLYSFTILVNLSCPSMKIVFHTVLSSHNTKMVESQCRNCQHVIVDSGVKCAQCDDFHLCLQASYCCQRLFRFNKQHVVVVYGRLWMPYHAAQTGHGGKNRRSSSYHPPAVWT